MLCIVNFAGTDKKAEEEIRWFFFPMIRLGLDPRPPKLKVGQGT